MAAPLYTKWILCIENLIAGTFLLRRTLRLQNNIQGKNGLTFRIFFPALCEC
jgi:hypothetical protein